MLICSSSAQARRSAINAGLKAQLDSIHILDQQYRRLAANMNQEQEDSLALHYHIPRDSVYNYLMSQQERLDKYCLHAVASIISKHGYPGKSVVGSPANEAAFYVIQHSDQIGRYLPLLKKEAGRKELPFELVAMMEDRWLTEQGKEQIYGTQLWANSLIKDSVSGTMRPDYFFYPIEDIRNVNRRRRQAGFPSTVEEYAREMGIAFRIKEFGK